MDYQVNCKLAEEYYNKINAQKRELYIIKDTIHGLMMSKLNEFLDLLHLIFNSISGFMYNLSKMQLKKTRYSVKFLKGIILCINYIKKMN